MCARGVSREASFGGPLAIHSPCHPGLGRFPARQLLASLPLATRVCTASRLSLQYLPARRSRWCLSVLLPCPFCPSLASQAQPRARAASSCGGGESRHHWVVGSS
ncbi:hypothetical protein GQ53DRAFT_63079 [Thozetella sp. PMI_491]|nr:hypothetical protein GQ53DRAFT_63079 [Thozetella sp. PMI_491]